MFGFLAKTDLNALAIGNHDIVKGRCWVTISEYVPRLAENVKSGESPQIYRSSIHASRK